MQRLLSRLAYDNPELQAAECAQVKAFALFCGFEVSDPFGIDGWVLPTPDLRPTQEEPMQSGRNQLHAPL